MIKRELHRRRKRTHSRQTLGSICPSTLMSRCSMVTMAIAWALSLLMFANLTSPAPSHTPPVGPPRDPKNSVKPEESELLVSGKDLSKEGGQGPGRAAVETWNTNWFGAGRTKRTLHTVGETNWEVLDAIDVVGADLESVADFNMAVYSCYTNPKCAGFVWSKAQGQAYLKSNTKRRSERKKELQLSLYLKAYREYPGFGPGIPRFEGPGQSQEISKSKVLSLDGAREKCEETDGCNGFLVSKEDIERSPTGSPPISTTFLSLPSPPPPSEAGRAVIFLREGGTPDMDPGKVTGYGGRAGGDRARDISSTPPIVVGGTDGSGTRAVVTLLSNLNVLMVKDDSCTFDVHAGEMGGWPPVVQRVLKYTHGADYKVSDVPKGDREIIRENIRKFAEKMKKEARRFSLMHPHKRWGFKAPIAQMLLPFLNEVFPGFSFVHVVRDGRDLPFSKNQSPVDKFYSFMYEGQKSSLQLPKKLKAIRMWSDANVQVKHYMEKTHQPSGGTYLMMNIERSVEEKSLLEMGYVCNEKLNLGFDKKSMCCRLLGYIRHLKKADFFHGVKSRYGKWKKLTSNDPLLRTQLQKEGNKGLLEFGYLDTAFKPLLGGSTLEVCEGIPEIETSECTFDFPSKCIESPDIR